MSSSKAKYRQRCASESDSRLRQGLHNGATRDIVTLLSKAKDEYNMVRAQPAWRRLLQLARPDAVAHCTASSACSDRGEGSVAWPLSVTLSVPLFPAQEGAEGKRECSGVTRAKCGL